MLSVSGTSVVQNTVREGCAGTIDLPDGSDVGTLTIQVGSSAGNANSVNRTITGILAENLPVDLVESPLRNYYQLITVDASSGYAIADACIASGNTSPTLSVPVRRGVDTKVLLLAGFQNSTETPTLLGSAYASFRPLNSGDMVEFVISPVVSGIEFYVEGNRDATLAETGRIARRIMLSPNTNYTMKVNIGWASNAAVGDTGDVFRPVTGDGLSPLQEASEALGIGFSSNTASNAHAWYDLQGSFNPDDGGGIPANKVEHPENGDRAYYFTIPSGSVTTGPTLKMAVFRLSYNPFDLPESSWKKDGDPNGVWRSFMINGVLTQLQSIPTWFIRNGLNDVLQTVMAVNTTSYPGTDRADQANSLLDYGTDFQAFAAMDANSRVGTTAKKDGIPVNANGGIAIAVMSDTSSLSYGLFEGSNRYPIIHGGEASSSSNLLDHCVEYLNTALLNRDGAKFGTYRIEIEERADRAQRPINLGNSLAFDSQSIYPPYSHEGIGGLVKESGLTINLKGNAHPTLYLSEEGPLFALPSSLVTLNLKDITLHGLYAGSNGSSGVSFNVLPTQNSAQYQAAKINNDNTDFPLLYIGGIVTLDNTVVECNFRNGNNGSSNAAGIQTIHTGIVSLKGNSKVWKNYNYATTGNGWGGGVSGAGKFIMEDSSSVTENVVYSYYFYAYGGGVCCVGSGVLKMQGGTIAGNISYDPGKNLAYSQDSKKGAYWPSGTKGFIGGIERTPVLHSLFYQMSGATVDNFIVIDDTIEAVIL
jgi:hypothetical protein